jgi:hypothetical protein
VVENERDSRRSARTVPGPWLAAIEHALQPARPELERCIRERELHRGERQVVNQRRAAAIAACMTRIESARAAVFAADTGAVPQLMTDLEREWRMLSRKDADDGLMDLWARITPVSWHDRKRWRDSSATAKVDAAVALAADVRGVEAAESAAMSLRSALAAWGVTLGARIRWKSIEHEVDAVTELLAEPLLAAQAALASAHADGIRLSAQRGYPARGAGGRGRLSSPGSAPPSRRGDRSCRIRGVDVARGRDRRSAGSRRAVARSLEIRLHARRGRRLGRDARNTAAVIALP